MSASFQDFQITAGQNSSVLLNLPPSPGCCAKTDEDFDFLLSFNIQVPPTPANGTVTLELQAPSGEAQEIGTLPSNLDISFNFVYYGGSDGFFSGVPTDGGWKVTFQPSDGFDWGPFPNQIILTVRAEQCGVNV